MNVITEAYMRTWVRDKNRSATFCLGPKTIITPAAKQFIQEQRIELQQGVEENIATKSSKGKFRSIDGGERYDVKAEHMTQLHGMILVQKDHPRIVFRGRLDSLQSDILLLHSRAKEYSVRLADQLEEILNWVRSVLQAEVLEKPLVEREIFSMTALELRAHSHNPQKYYNIGHILPDVNMEPIILEMNRLRSTIREIELVAVEAFVPAEHPAASDILRAMNRMSSAVYVLMLKCSAGEYSNGN